MLPFFQALKRAWKNDMTNPTYRVGVYIDGAFFRNVGVYFNYGPLRYGWVDFHGLQEFIVDKVESLLKGSPLPGKQISMVNVVRCSIYDGRGPEVKDKSLDKRLRDANVEGRLFPLQERVEAKNGRVETVLVQKGIQTELVCDALSAAYRDQFDVAVLVSGDQELVPLAKALQEANRPVILLTFEIPEWEDSNGVKHRPTTASHRLVNAVSFSVDVCEEIRQDERLSTSLFSP